MSNTGPTGPEFIQGMSCPSCGSESVIQAQKGYSGCNKCGCTWDDKYFLTRTPLSLKDRYKAVVGAYITEFCKKQDLSDGYWIENRIGEIYDVADMSLDFQIIRYDMDTNQPKGRIIKYYWEMLDKMLSGSPNLFPSYEGWCATTKKKEGK